MSAPTITQSIMLLRHAEKPDDENHGVDKHGHKDDAGLTVQGWQRAGALVAYFMQFKPNALLAAAIDHNSHSERSFDTLLPLAKRLHLNIDDQYSVDHTKAVAEHAMGLGGVVLLAWHHTHIPAIAQAICPDMDFAAWPDHQYDKVWVFDYQYNTGRYGFMQMNQSLLHGDA